MAPKQQQLQQQQLEWDKVTQPFFQNNPVLLLHNLLQLLGGPKRYFKDLQTGLKEKCLDQVSDENGVLFLSKCLESILLEEHEAFQEGQNDIMLGHLLLELFPDKVDISAVIEDDVRLQLFESACSIKRARVAVKIAQIYEITWALLKSTGQLKLQRYVEQLWENKSLYSSAVGLMIQFKELEKDFDVKIFLSLLLGSSSEITAEKWLPELSLEFQCHFVNQCIEMDRLRTANRVVRNLELEAEFPYVEAMYRRSTLARLAEKQQWQVAATFVGEDKELREELIQAMVIAEEYKQAKELCKQFGLDPLLAEVDEEKLLLAEEKRNQKYFQIPLEMDKIYFVGQPEQIEFAEQVLKKQKVVGLDVEWKPQGSSAASILQVGCQEGVFLFDLIALNGDQKLKDLFQFLFQSAGILKLGFEFGGDLKMLRSSYPHIHAFQEIQELLEMKDVWSLYNKRAQAIPIQGFGLSSLCEHFLRKPLDKAMQCSNWEQRPLSQLQIRYAALDALVLVLILQKIMVPQGPLYEQEIKSLTKTVSVQNLLAQKRNRDNSDQSDSQDEQDDGNNGPSSSNGNGSQPSRKQNSQKRRPDKDNDDIQNNIKDDRKINFDAKKQSKVALPQNLECQQFQDSIKQQDGNVNFVSHILSQFGLQNSLIDVDEEGISTARAEEAAEALNVGIGQIAKSVAFIIGNSKALIAVVPGNKRVDIRKIGEELGVSKRQIRVASADQCVEEFGYVPGVMPPFGHKCECTVIFDQQFICPEDWQQEQGQDLDYNKGLFGAVQNEYVQDDYSQEDQNQRMQEGQNDLSGSEQVSMEVEIQKSQQENGAVENPEDDWQQYQVFNPKSKNNYSMFDNFEDALNLLSAPCDQDDVFENNNKTTLVRRENFGLYFGKQSEDYLYCGSGSEKQAVKLTLTDLLRVSKGRIGHIAESSINAPVSMLNNMGKIQPNIEGARFTLDSMLGRLCRWLRCLGVDAEFVGVGHKRTQLIQLALQATQQGRVFLTRDIKLASQKDCGAVYLLSHDDPARQLREVADHFGITMKNDTVMSRCSKCNAAEFAKIEPREKAKSLVPERVYKLDVDFWQCGKCAKVFWVGPKSQAAIELVSGVLARRRQNTENKLVNFWDDGYSRTAIP